MAHKPAWQLNAAEMTRCLDRAKQERAETVRRMAISKIADLKQAIRRAWMRIGALADAAHGRPSSVR